MSLCNECCGENDEPCCWRHECEPTELGEGSGIGLCIHCGCEMFEERGCWFTHDQEDIPFENRKPHWCKI